MKSSYRQDMADKLSKKIMRMRDRHVTERTGKEALNALLDLEPTESQPQEQRKQIILFLRDGLSGVERNWTKYPNEIHQIMASRLDKEYESVAYVYLWRQSWGFGRNYCRTSYSRIIQDTVISARNTARRALAGLMDKQFIVKALDQNWSQDVNQEGALYRVFMPSEIQDGITEEGISISDIPKDGVPTQVMPTEGTAVNDNTHGSFNTMTSLGMPNQSMPRSSSAQKGQGTMPKKGMPRGGIAEANPHTPIPDNTSAQRGHATDEHALKDNKDSLKDTLSPHAIVSGFYKGIGQSRISKEKRERAENDFKELLEDGFDPGDVQFAVEWTLKNAKEELYDFSIIKHTIGQAMVAKKKAEEGEAKKREKERIAAQEEAEEKRKAEEERQIKAYKESLDADERVRLRQRAEAEIKNSGQYKTEFITDYLIEAMENNLIRNQIDMRPSE